MNTDNLRKMIYSAWGSARKALASPNMRRYRAWLFQVYILAALLAFSFLAFMANTIPYFSLDLVFTRWLQADIPTWFGVLLQWVSWIGFAIQSIVLISLVAILLGTLGLRWEAIVSILAGVSSGALNTLVKIVIRRPRPTEDLVHVFQSLNSYSFPSGHTMFYMTFFGFLLFLAFVLLKHSWKRRLLIFLLSALIILIGPSRMYLGEHWGSDVLAGYLLGSLTLILTIQIYHWGKKRYVVEQPVAPENTAPKPTKQVLQEDLKITPRIPVTSEKAEKHEHRADRTKPK